MTTAPNERVVFRDYPVGVWFTGLIAFAVAIVSYHRSQNAAWPKLRFVNHAKTDANREPGGALRGAHGQHLILRDFGPSGELTENIQLFQVRQIDERFTGRQGID